MRTQLRRFTPIILRRLALKSEYDPLGSINCTAATANAILCSGFEFDLRSVSKEDIEEAILAANVDDSVHGIIVYYPIFPRSSRQDQYIQQLVALDKDVEGLSHKYIFNMYQNIRFLDPPTNKQKSILPCTPLAVVKVLEYLQIYNPALPYGNRLFGRTITVINRSEVVGRPLAALLANDGAKVYSVDINDVQLFTRGRGIKNLKHEVHEQGGWTVEQCLPFSDVVISGVPGSSYKIDTNLIRDGAVCINFSSEKNFDATTVKEQASFYVPAIGKVTISVLLRNLLVRFPTCAPLQNADFITRDLSTTKKKVESRLQ
jgi:methylenetetrahydrofolate dehydrogenase (NAD+)